MESMDDRGTTRQRAAATRTAWLVAAIAGLVYALFWMGGVLRA